MTNTPQTPKQAKGKQLQGVAKIVASNKVTYESLRDFLRLLSDQGAIIGRLGFTVVLKRDRVPEIISDDWHRFMGLHLSAVDGFGRSNLLCDKCSDAQVEFLGFPTLSDDLGVGAPEWLCVNMNDSFPFVEESRALIKAIGEISGCIAAELLQRKAAIDDGIQEMLGMRNP